MPLGRKYGQGMMQTCTPVASLKRGQNIMAWQRRDAQMNALAF